MSRVNKKSPDHEYLCILTQKWIRTNGKCPLEGHGCKASTQEATSITPQFHTAPAVMGMTAFACLRWVLPTCISEVPVGVNPLVCSGLLGVSSWVHVRLSPDLTWPPNNRKTSQAGGCFSSSWLNIDVERLAWRSWWLSISSWIISIFIKASKMCV